METRRFHKRGPEFVVLDLIASFAFKSSTSISFDLGRYGDTLSLPDDGISLPVGPRGVFRTMGWIDVHHPCEREGTAKLRICLPREYHGWEKLQQIVNRVLSELSIPVEEPYHATCCDAKDQTGIINPWLNEFLA